MEQYVPKSALLAEIEKRECLLDLDNPLGRGGMVELEFLKNTINNLEVKSMDFEKEVDAEWNKCNPVDEGMGCEFATIGIEQFYFITKYFFELGLNTQKEKINWSEEDEIMLRKIIQYTISLSEGCEVDLNDQINWLKSIKERMQQYSITDEK